MIGALTHKISVGLAPASQTAAATRSVNIDCIGSDYVTIPINLAARVNTSAVAPTIALTESDDTTATNFATWSSSCSRSESLASAHILTFKVNTKGRKRYLNLAITAATQTTNDIVTAAAELIFSRRESEPVGTANMCGSTNDVVVIL